MTDKRSLTQEEIESKVTYLFSNRFNHTLHAYIDITGDLVAGTLLSQIMYWFSKSKKNETRVTIYRDGNYWIAKKREDWFEEIRISPKQYDRAIKTLQGVFKDENKKEYIDESKKYVEVKKFHFNGIPTTHIRPISKNINNAISEWKRNLAIEILGDNVSMENGNSPKGDLESSKGEFANSPKVNIELLEEVNSYNIYNNINNINSENTNRDYTNNSLSSERASESDFTTTKKQSRKKEANELFERVWKLYPKKFGKGQVSDTQKLKLLDIGFDELGRAIQRCCLSNKDRDRQYWQNSSTFFNSGYIDFLDENYEDYSSPNALNVREVQKEPLSEKERIRIGIEKARETFGEDYGESYWNGMDDSNIIITLEYLGIRVDEF